MCSTTQTLFCVHWQKGTCKATFGFSMHLISHEEERIRKKEKHCVFLFWSNSDFAVSRVRAPTSFTLRLYYYVNTYWLKKERENL